MWEGRANGRWEVGVVTKGQHKGSLWWKYLPCGGGCMNLHMQQNCRQLNIYTCRHKWVKENWVNLSKIAGLFQYLYSCDIVLQFWKEESSFPERCSSKRASWLTKDVLLNTLCWAGDPATCNTQLQKLPATLQQQIIQNHVPIILNIEENIRWSLTPESTIPFSNKDSTLFGIYLLLLEC